MSQTLLKADFDVLCGIGLKALYRHSFILYHVIMPPHDSALEEIKNRIDIVDLISGYVNLKHAGQNWKGLCPFHAEKTPSFTVSPSKQIYHCFGCSSGGDIFTFLMKYENVTFPEAVSILAKKAGVTLKPAQKDTVASGEKEVLFSMHRDAVSFFQQHLNKNTKADGYLTGRGINAEARQRFSLGYAPRTWNALLTYLTRKGYKMEMIMKSGLVTQGAKGVYDTFRDRIMFPIHDLKGDVIAFGGRIMENEEPKYLNSPETVIFNKRRVLYGLHQAKESIKTSGHALFMEGYLDVITSHMYGFRNSVAPLGTAFTQEHGKLIKRFVEEVVLVFDSDEAGRKAARNAANILFEAGLDVRVLSFPDKEDPDSFLRKRGEKAFQELLNEPLTIIDFYTSQKKDRKEVVGEALETISVIPNRILQGEYIKALSEKLGIRESYVAEEFQRIRKPNRPADKSFSPPAGPGVRQLEEYLIKILLKMPEKTGEASGMISEEDFQDAASRAVFQKIKSGVSDFHELLARSEGGEREFLTGISFDEDFENPEKVFDDCVKKIRGNRRKTMLQELQGRIREAESKKDLDLLRSLQAEQQKLLRSG